MKRIQLLFTAMLGLTAAALLLLLAVLTWSKLSAPPTGALALELQRLQARAAVLQAKQTEFTEWTGAERDYARFIHDTCYPQSDFPALRRELRELFVKHGLNPVGVKYTTSRVVDGLVRATLHYSLDAPYQSQKGFFYELERHPRLLFLRSMQLSAAPTSPTLHGQFVLEAYLGE